MGYEADEEKLNKLVIEMIGCFYLAMRLRILYEASSFCLIRLAFCRMWVLHNSQYIYALLSFTRHLSLGIFVI